MTPLVSIIIPVYKNVDGLRKLLESLQANETASEWEVIVCDNEGSEEIARVANCYSRATYVKELTPGSYAARNCGVRAAKGRILAFTDSDCFVRKDYIEAVVSNAMNSKSGVLGGEVVVDLEAGKVTAWALLDSLFEFRLKEMIEKTGVTVTANLVVRREVFDFVGEFDSLLRSGGDTAWCRKALGLGHGVKYCENIVVFHPPRATAKEHYNKALRVLAGYIDRTVVQPETYRLWPVVRGRLIPPLRRVAQVLGSNGFSAWLRVKAASALISIWLVQLAFIVPMILFPVFRKRFR